MPGLRGKGVFLCLLLWSASCVFLFCEYLIYFPAVWRCSWPEPGGGSGGSGGSGGQAAPVLRALVLSDTHLLGALRGHWFDKLRREWQMERAFQTALWLLQPEVVFILGDIFDEGKWSSPEDWEDDVRRFLQMFRHPSDTELVVVVGNHDIGFHYEMSWFKLQRFEKVFNATSARIVTRKGVNFLLVNSVALHGDGCSICQSVEKELFRLSHALNCSTQAGSMGERCRDVRKLPSSRPIILQHYPLYRANDAGCAGEDAAPPEERNLLFKEQYDVLSQAASQKLVWWFRPRLILSGHTHSACEVLHEDLFPEISVPSFSWRNRNNPSFILGSFTSETFNLSKCFLPQESTVIAIYCACAAVLIVLTLVHFHLFKGTLHCASCLMSKHKSL
uniref:Metallophosphoesterase 1 n=1 Tax=Lepisosteus oculatus TaxID=7918 RepID=W5M2B8_LEPOC|nr:PREDICTED: metallophosphoesterase 1 isoform X1 [Lepisosteus oculatus]XP_015209059.1 PREDICTED: metallophosphoesterase 1 isoform X1 [Lepisosteus oculatus]XP_015209060.1 PREDICTED: metallophosphoesterase 1 isoform X1 [Lepisosteus oculatus]